MNDSGDSGLGLHQQTSGPSSPRSISTSGNTLVDPDVQRTPSIPRSCPIWPTVCNQPVEWTNEKDPINDLNHPCHGWPDLAKLMSENPGLEAFQSFKDLHIKSLLYYQAQLDGMRKDLHLHEWADHRLSTFPNAAKLSSRADTLLLCEGKTEEQRAQIDKVNKMRIVLKDYSDALLRYSKINELPVADPFNVNTLHNLLRKPDSENRERHIAGNGSDSWGKLDEDLPDEKTPGQQFIHFLRSLTIFWAEKQEPKKPLYHLVVPGKRRDADGLTRWVANQWIPFWDNVRKYITAPEDTPGTDPEHQVTDKKDDERRPSNISTAPTLVKVISRAFIGRRPSTGGPTENPPDKTDKDLVTYRIRRIRTFTTFITTIVACLLPTAAIAILATMHSTAKVLGFIGLFTALFAAGLMCLTDSSTSRTEIFTATAAFSAVLVVFVQNQNGAPGGSNG
jgi:hypothetical protein